MAGKKILIVEDEVVQLTALARRLKSAGFEIVAARDGLTAISTARKEQPDLILLDLGLPAGDGFVVLQRLGMLINTGTIRGPVDLGGGNDLFNGTGGTSGPVFGGDGNDRLIGGSHERRRSAHGEPAHVEVAAVGKADRAGHPGVEGDPVRPGRVGEHGLATGTSQAGTAGEDRGG